MGRINLARVLVGGFIAGLIINASEFVLNVMVIEEQMNAAMAALNQPPIAPSMIIWFVLFELRVRLHSGLDVCRHPAAPWRRIDDRHLRRDPVLGPGVPLSESVLLRDEPVPAKPDRSDDDVATGRDRCRRSRRSVGLY